MDPLGGKYAHQSSYCYADCNPVMKSDPGGMGTGDAAGPPRSLECNNCDGGFKNKPIVLLSDQPLKPKEYGPSLEEVTGVPSSQINREDKSKIDLKSVPLENSKNKNYYPPLLDVTKLANTGIDPSKIEFKFVKGDPNTKIGGGEKSAWNVFYAGELWGKIIVNNKAQVDIVQKDLRLVALGDLAWNGKMMPFIETVEAMYSAGGSEMIGKGLQTTNQNMSAGAQRVGNNSIPSSRSSFEVLKREAAGHVENSITNLPPVSVTDRLQAHVNRAAQEVDALGNNAFTNRQLLAIQRNHNLLAAYRGNRIDVRARGYIENDPTLQHLISNYTNGPDFVDPQTGNWWDITTPAQWQSHVNKYGANGTLLRTR